jgi:hypothetical protein
MTNAFERLLERVDGMAVLTQEQIETLLRDYFARQWAVAEEVAHFSRDRHDKEFDPVHEAVMTAEEAEALRQRAAARLYTPADRADAKELLEAHGYSAKGIDLEGMDILCHGILLAKAETRRILAALLEGRREDATPRDPLFAGMASPGLPPLGGYAPPPPSLQSIQLSELFEAWKAGRNAKTVAEFSKGIRRFTELHGDIAAVTITKPMVREFLAYVADRRWPRMSTCSRT